MSIAMGDQLRTTGVQDLHSTGYTTFANPDGSHYEVPTSQAAAESAKLMGSSSWAGPGMEISGDFFGGLVKGITGAAKGLVTGGITGMVTGGISGAVTGSKGGGKIQTSGVGGAVVPTVVGGVINRMIPGVGGLVGGLTGGLIGSGSSSCGCNGHSDRDPCTRQKISSQPAPLATFFGGCCPPGRVLRRVNNGRDICAKKAVMNPFNPRALARADRRVKAFAGRAAPMLKELGFQVSRSRRPQLAKKGRKRAR